MRESRSRKLSVPTSKVDNVNQNMPRSRPLADVVRDVKSWVERCGWVWVEGQIIELNRRTGRQFFTLRDRDQEISARLSCQAHVLDAAGPLTVNTQVIAEVQRVVDEANTSVSRAESIRKFEIIDADFTEENGYLTPSFKLKRAAVVKDFSEVIDRIYTKK